MDLNCLGLLALPPFKSAKLVAGKRGLGNIIRWVHIAESSRNPDEIFTWMKRRDLLVVIGTFLKERPGLLGEIIHKAIEMEFAGVVFYKSAYLDSIPADICSLADENSLPVFLLEDETVSVTEITFDVCRMIMNDYNPENTFENILIDILYENTSNVDMFVIRADFYHYNLRRPHQAIVFNFSECKAKGKNRKERLPDNNFYEKIKKSFDETLKAYHPNILSTFTESSYIALVPESGRTLEKIAGGMMSGISEDFKELSVVCGIGNIYDRVENFRESIKEAQKIVRIMNRLGMYGKIRKYGDMHIYMMLNELNDNKILREIYRKNLGPLISYDKANSNNLCETLKVFLEQDKNINVTADLLYIHRNTLKYRLSKIEDLCGKSLDNSYDSFELFLAFYIENILENN
jgi:sugar diacid utilization regulator